MRRLLLIALALVLVTGCSKLMKKSKSGEAEEKSGGGGGAPAGQGTVQAVRGAVQRTVTEHDLNQIRIFIDAASLAGRMPTVQQTAEALQKEAPKIYALVQEGLIVLHPASTREGVWAYTQQPQHGGQHLVVASSGVERMSAQDLHQRLQQGQ